jgi:hypothetical protein
MIRNLIFVMSLVTLTIPSVGAAQVPEKSGPIIPIFVVKDVRLEMQSEPPGVGVRCHASENVLHLPKGAAAAFVSLLSMEAQFPMNSHHERSFTVRLARFNDTRYSDQPLNCSPPEEAVLATATVTGAQAQTVKKYDPNIYAGLIKGFEPRQGVWVSPGDQIRFVWFMNSSGGIDRILKDRAKAVVRVFYYCYTAQCLLDVNNRDLVAAVD